MAGITPWTVGQTSPTWTIVCQRDGNTFDLTGQLASNINILFYSNVQTANINGNVSYTKIATGTGTVTVVSPLPGVIEYVPNTNDTANLTPGQYWFRVEVKMGGTNPDYSDYLPLFVGA
jgi:hypothetical protein